MNYDPVMLGLEVEGHSGDEYKVCCPIHGDNHASASFNAAKGLFFCYACGATGDAKWVADVTGGYVGAGEATERYVADNSEVDWAQWGRSPLAIDNEYLQSRRVTNEQVVKFDIRQNHTGVLFPLQDNVGQIIGYQMRKYEGKPKYMFYGAKPDFWPFFNLNTNEPIFIVEGVFSVLRLDRVGLKAVCIFGTGNAKRVAPFFRGKDAYALFDTDDAGLVAAAHFIRSGMPGVPAILLPPHWPDPDELNPKQMRRLMEFRTASVKDLIRRSTDWKAVASRIHERSNS